MDEADSLARTFSNGLRLPPRSTESGKAPSFALDAELLLVPDTSGDLTDSQLNEVLFILPEDKYTESDFPPSHTTKLVMNADQKARLRGKRQLGDARTRTNRPYCCARS